MKLKASLGSGHGTSGCGGCGEVFTGLGNFDRHQRWIDGTLTCLDPADCGMQKNAYGRWFTPSDGDAWWADDGV